MAFFPGGPVSHPGPGPGIHFFGPGGGGVAAGVPHPGPVPVRSGANLADFLKAAAGVHPRAGANMPGEVAAAGRAVGSMGDLYPQLAMAAGGHLEPGASGLPVYRGPGAPGWYPGMEETGVQPPSGQIDTGYNPAVYQRTMGNTAQAAADWEAHHPYQMSHGHIPAWIEKWQAGLLSKSVARRNGPLPAAPPAAPVQPQAY